MPTEAYECTLSGILAGQFVQTVFHTNYINGSSQPPFFAAKDIAEQLAASGEFIDNFVACLPADYQATSLRVRRVGPTGGPTAIVLASGMNLSAGQRPAQISSAQVCPLLIFIPTTAPSKTGRMFMPGVSEDDIENMVMVTALVTELEALITYIVGGTTIAGGGVEFSVLRRLTKVGDPIDAGYVSPLIGTQRRRLRPV
jgi:hypothetical protein